MAGISIFYDLETSDKEPIGQILNFCFTLVDGQWNALRSCSGNVRISRLQLPSAGAILTNRIDVLKHQNSAELCEFEAAKKIHAFINAVLKEQGGQSVPLIGYNSNRFDLPFLRTTLVRNGLNPYFGGKLVYRDLLQLVRKLVTRNPEFPSCLVSKPQGSETLDLTLSNICKLHGLLIGEQTHTSCDDVTLTIELAQQLLKRYRADVRTCDTFEARSFTHKGRGTLLSNLTPNYDTPGQSLVKARPYLLVDADPRQTLWVDLERYRCGAGRDSIRYLNSNTHAFFTDGEWPQGETLTALAHQVTKEFNDITTRNYFQTSDCDIEQDIYRLPINDHELLGRVIEGTEPATKLNRDGKVLMARYKMANAVQSTPELDKRLAEYSRYRYGGQLKLVKWNTSNEDLGEGTRPTHHATLAQMRGEILEGIHNFQSADDCALLKSLLSFYDNSDVVRLVGKEFSLASAA